MFFFLCGLLLLSSCASQKISPTEQQASVDYDLLIGLPEEPVDYQGAIRPVLDRRCVVCHGCWDAPCQLKLSSMEGLQRGANPQRVYDGARISATEPTRLFIDAHGSGAWREKGFHSVLNDTDVNSPETNLDASVIYQILRLKQLNPQPRVGMLPDEVDVSLDRAQTCATSDNFEQYAKEHPLWGMPYGLPNLSDEEYRKLVQWLAQGAPGQDNDQPSAQALPQIERWERFLNNPNLKQQLVSRYLYEHLFLAHIHFAGTASREFYRLVRSTTPTGRPVQEIPTIRPYDDPGGRFYYRLVRYQASVVLKDHNVYEWSDTRMERYRDLFIAPDYVVSELPPYDSSIASNPFKVFAVIPVESRYRFLIDDAKYFIEGFIKGPVCRGQVALNVIEDHFWVFFINPDSNVISLDDEFVNDNAELLAIPSAQGDTLNIFSIWTDYWKREKTFLEKREAHFETYEKQDYLKGLELIWDGQGENKNAALTVFRHFDSASVKFGLHGNYPETAWIIDYPLFERIHYLLVAGFNVYGNVGHQLNTRLYMDFLRMEGEIFFLAFMPVEDRKRIRDTWYQGIHSQVDRLFDQPMRWMDVDSVGGYRTNDPQREFYLALESHLGQVAGKNDYINRCSLNECQGKTPPQAELDIDLAMQKLVSISGEILKVFPDVSFIRVLNDNGDEDLAYTLIRNKAYTNISSMLSNVDQRDRSNDTLTVLKGLEGSYPNFFFVVKRKDIDAFVDRFTTIGNRRAYEEFVALYGIRRTNQTFWEQADWFHDWALQHEPVVSGIYDLNRYRNR
jgi:hypothetical protein